MEISFFRRTSSIFTKKTCPSAAVNRWNCLYIDVSWVNEQYRKAGYGTALLSENFYIRHGYEVFGVLDDYPKEHKRYYMKKV